MAGKIEVLLPPDAVVVLGRYSVTHGSGGLLVLKDGIQVYPHPANQNVPQLTAMASPDSSLWTEESLSKIPDGHKLPDGHVIFGRALTSRDSFYRAVRLPKGDDSDVVSFPEAFDRAEKMTAGGYKDWRLPYEAEADPLFCVLDATGLTNYFNHEKGFWLADPVEDPAKASCWDPPKKSSKATRKYAKRMALFVREFQALEL